MTKIVVNNIFSHLETDRQTLKTVRHHVAYRSRLMPPIEAQKLIKGFFSARKRYGRDLERMWADSGMLEKLAEHGVTPETLTRSQFESTLRQRGVWDGWVRMVEGSGKFPTGLLRHVERALTLRAEIHDYTVDDARSKPPAGIPAPEIDLFDYQKEAVEAFLGESRGVVNLPPRSGKTRIAAGVIARLGLPTLYLAPTVGIVNQTQAVFSELLPTLTTIALHGGLSSSAKKHREILKAHVWVATPRTAVKLPNLHNRHLLVIDEFHHSSAKTWQAVSHAAVGAYWRLGLTGTHFRADGKDMEMSGVLGRAIYTRSVGDMVDLGRLVPAKIAMLRIRGTVEGSGYEVYREGVVDNDHRNEVLAMAANRLVEDGRRVLVLTKEIGHAQTLSSMIRGSVAVDGRDNDNVDAMLKALADVNNPVKAVVGTSVIGEGRDVPAADAVVYASGGQSKVKVVQDYFRALTANVGKSAAIIVDAADTQHPILSKHAARRLQHYRMESAFDAAVVEPNEFASWLYDNRTIGKQGA